MATSDSLRLRVSAADYQQRIGALDGKINELNAILGDII